MQAKVFSVSEHTGKPWVIILVNRMFRTHFKMSRYKTIKVNFWTKLLKLYHFVEMDKLPTKISTTKPNYSCSNDYYGVSQWPSYHYKTINQENIKIKLWKEKAISPWGPIHISWGSTLSYSPLTLTTKLIFSGKVGKKSLTRWMQYCECIYLESKTPGYNSASM